MLSKTFSNPITTIQRGFPQSPTTPKKATLSPRVAFSMGYFTASFPYSKNRLHLLFLLQCQQRLHVECTFETLFLNLAANFVRLSYIAVE